MRFSSFSLLLSIAGCNALLGQHPARATLTLGVPFVWVAQNGQLAVPFTIARGDENGALTVHASALPPGVTAPDVTVADGSSNGTLTLFASSASTLGARSPATIDLLHDADIDDEQTLTVGASGLSGSLDTTWGSGGVVTLPLVNPTANYVLDLDADEIVVAGTLVNSDADVRLIIARYEPDGSLDATFGDPSGGTRLGYTLFNPGVSTNNLVATMPVGLRVDSQGRVVMANERASDHCYAEVGRWTDRGDIDPTFHRYSNEVNGTQYCGAAAALALTPTDDIVLLARWNFLTGVETLIQLFDPDGSPTSTFHLTLDPSGTSQTNQRMTEMFDMHLDDRGGFVVAGRQYAGSDWTIGGPTAPVIARVAADGQRDTSFGASPAFTSFSFGSGQSQLFWHVGIEPVSKDIVAVGENDIGTLATMARVSGTTGLPTGFEQTTIALCPGGESEALTQVMFDSQSRIVATGSCSMNGVGFIARLRAHGDATFDTTYGDGGIATTQGSPEGATLGADDRLYVVGEINSTAAIWRFWP